MYKLVVAILVVLGGWLALRVFELRAVITNYENDMAELSRRLEVLANFQRLPCSTTTEILDRFRDSDHEVYEKDGALIIDGARFRCKDGRLQYSAEELQN